MQRPSGRKSKYSGGTNPGPAWLEEKEGPKMRLKNEGEASSSEMLLLILADADPFPLD